MLRLRADARELLDAGGVSEGAPQRPSRGPGAEHTDRAYFAMREPLYSPRPRGASMDLLTVTTTSGKGVLWVVSSGEVDLANRADLRTSLAAIQLGSARTAYLDLRQLTFCDSEGCRMLVRFERRAVAAGYDVRIHRAGPIVRKVMSLVGDLD